MLFTFKSSPIGIWIVSQLVRIPIHPQGANANPSQSNAAAVLQATGAVGLDSDAWNFQ